MNLDVEERGIKKIKQLVDVQHVQVYRHLSYRTLPLRNCRQLHTLWIL